MTTTPSPLPSPVRIISRAPLLAWFTLPDSATLAKRPFCGDRYGSAVVVATKPGEVLLKFTK